MYDEQIIMPDENYSTSHLKTDIELLKLQSIQQEDTTRDLRKTLDSLAKSVRDLVTIQSREAARNEVNDAKAEARDANNARIAKEHKEQLNNIFEKIRAHDTRISTIEKIIPLLKLTHGIVLTACGAILILAWSGVIGK